MRLTCGSVRVMVFVAVLVGSVTTACAQSEDVEPRIIAHRGVTLLGVSGSLSRYFSSEDLFAGTYTVQVDGHHFISKKIALRFGAIGSDTFGGDSDDSDSDDSDSDDSDADESDSSDNDDTGTSLAANAVEVLGGAVYYFTPESVWSFYGGGEYRARVMQRSTADKDLGVLKAFFNWCIDRGLAASNPVRRVKFFHSNNERIRYLLDEEWDRLRTAAAALEGRSPSLVDKMVLARNTGLRRANLFRAHWSWVDWLNRVIRVPRTKNNVAHAVPLNDTAYATLKRLYAGP